MERTKRQRNAIFINFTVFTTFTLIAVFVMIQYIIPGIQQVEAEKSETMQLYNKLQDISNKGIDFTTFTSTYRSIYKSIPDSDKNSFQKNLVENLKEKFYNDYFKNETDSNYQMYIKELGEKYTWADLDEKREEKISDILPEYSENSYENWQFLTDFKFVNYIESLMYTFNLSYNNPIWIGSLEVADNYEIDKTSTSLDKNILYIPLELDVTWRKSSILSFIYYLQNVGKIYVGEDNQISIFSVEALDSKPIHRTENINKKTDNDDMYEEKKSEFMLENPWYNTKIFMDYFDKRPNLGVHYNDNNNIFNNQIAEIETADFSGYIDSKIWEVKLVKGADEEEIKELLTHLVESNQLVERYSVRLKLKFFVKWLPKYKLDAFIVSTKNEYTELKEKISKAVSGNSASSNDQKNNTSLEKTYDVVTKKQLKNLYTTLENLSENVNSLSAKPSGWKNQNNDLITVYNKAYEIRKVIDAIQKKYEIISKENTDVWNTKKQ